MVRPSCPFVALYKRSPPAMFVILVPVLALPIMATIWYNSRPDREQRDEIKAARAVRRETPFTQRAWRTWRAFFWQLDFIGLFLFVVGFGLFFVTITTANSRTARWSDAHSIAQLVIGFAAIVGFVIWERYFAPHPLLPFALLRRKTVIGCCLIALFHPMAGRCASGYLYTFLQVAANQSTKSATRITAFPTLAGTITGIIGSLLARRYRTLKWFIVFGFCVQVLALGLMVRYRRATNSQGELAVVQLLRGGANGLIPFPTQALIQAAAPHEQLAAITAGWLVVYYISGGIGSAIGGSIWTNSLPGKISVYLGADAVGANQTIQEMAYNNPLGFARAFEWGSPEREALSRAQDEAQRTMVIVGTCIGVLALLSALFLTDNLRLTDDQSLPESEADLPQADRRKRGTSG